METCDTCKNLIDVKNPKTQYYTVRPGVYRCGECTNANLNIGYEEEMKKPINAVEAFAVIVTIATLVAIYYLVG